MVRERTRIFGYMQNIFVLSEIEIALSVIGMVQKFVRISYCQISSYYSVCTVQPQYMHKWKYFILNYNKNVLNHPKNTIQWPKKNIPNAKIQKKFNGCVYLTKLQFTLIKCELLLTTFCRKIIPHQIKFICIFPLFVTLNRHTLFFNYLSIVILHFIYDLSPEIVFGCFVCVFTILM